MTPYEELLAELGKNSDPVYREGHKKLLKDEEINVIGVRVPVMRKIAARYKGRVGEIMDFPDGYHEVTFVKLTAVSLLPYEEFIGYIDRCVPLIDNWATCDSFAPKCISRHREEFLPYIRKYAADGGEFSQRFALTTLLHFYVEEKYLETIFSLCDRCDTSKYYVHMAVSWLIAETLVKFYDRSIGYINEHSLDKKTHNKAIRKACESYRLSTDRKNYLKGIKR